MKAISLWPPYGSLIVAGVKKIETRSWPTKYRGVVAIHHTQQIPTQVYQSYCSGYFKEALQRANHPGLYHGCIVGTAEITECRAIDWKLFESLDADEIELGDFSIPGRFAWTLTNPVKFDKPIPAKGKQGIWEWQP